MSGACRMTSHDSDSRVLQGEDGAVYSDVVTDNQQCCLTLSGYLNPEFDYAAVGDQDDEHFRLDCDMPKPTGGEDAVAALGCDAQRSSGNNSEPAVEVQLLRSAQL